MRDTRGCRVESGKGSQGLPDGILIVPELIRGKAGTTENSVSPDQYGWTRTRSIVGKGTSDEVVNGVAVALGGFPCSFIVAQLVFYGFVYALCVLQNLAFRRVLNSQKEHISLS